MALRPPIPTQLKREVLMEAGHRCAIPTCKQIPVEIAHLTSWSKVKRHEFENLIALCPNCHTLFDNGKIDRQSMIQYKANLSILNGRYGDLEQRVLRSFAYNTENPVYLSKYLDILVMYIVDDGLIVKDEFKSVLGDYSIFNLTEKGKIFIKKWISAESIE